MTSEKPVARITNQIASVPAQSWTTFQVPLRRAASSGIELPAMKPATHAKPCRASTSELRKRTCPTLEACGGRVTPGMTSGVGSGGVTLAITYTASSSPLATSSDFAAHSPITGPGSVLQRLRVARVSAMPRTRARSWTLIVPCIGRCGPRPKTLDRG